MSASKSQHSAQPIRIFTMGFTGKSAKEFFETLQKAGVRRVVDIRLNNVSQLAGFAKKNDLQYFLQAIAGIEYTHNTDLAPSKDILHASREKMIDWEEYAIRFKQLLQERNPVARLRPEDFDLACLLCAELLADECHRRLVAEYLKEKWGNVVIHHL